MRTFYFAAVALLVTMACSTGAGAVTTVTGPVRSSEGDVLSCYAQNLSAAAVTVTAELHDSLGAVVDTGTLSVAAGRTLSLASTTNSVYGAYCTFTFSADPA